MKSLSPLSPLRNVLSCCVAAAVLQFAYAQEAAAQANLRVVDLEVGGSIYNDTQVTVTVTNSGTTAASYFYVDVFFDLARAPTVGTYSNTYAGVWGLAPGATTTVTVDVPYEHVEWRFRKWVDVIVDTDRLIPESREWDNLYDEYMWLYYFF